MDKRRSLANSAHKDGLDSIFQEVLIVVESGDGGDNKKTRDLQKSAPILLIAQQPEGLWTNGDDRRIRGVTLV